MPLRRAQDQSRLTVALTKGFAKMFGAVPRRGVRRGAQAWRGPGFRRLFRRDRAVSLAPKAADPVAMVVMAIDRLGPAAIRACCSGVNVRVTVPDDETASVFRAALAVTQTRRTTDRLIEIIVDAGQDKTAARA